jgi:hypothetical protein
MSDKQMFMSHKHRSIFPIVVISSYEPLGTSGDDIHLVVVVCFCLTPDEPSILYTGNVNAQASFLSLRLSRTQQRFKGVIVCAGLDIP